MSINKTLKENIGSSHFLPQWNPDICSFYFEENTWKEHGYLMPLVILKTRPCQWYSKGGGCTTCGYNLLAAIDNEITKKNLFNQVNYLTKVLPSSRFPFITLTSCGSFMDSSEIDDNTRLEILKILNKRGYKHINFESRPNVLRNEERLQNLHKVFDGDISVGIGLESSNDYIRRFCINKGYETKVFLEAVKALQHNDISYDAYILCGKPFLSPQEDIEDCVNSIKFAFNKGCYWVILMTANLQPHSLTYFMNNHGLYSLPKLWTPLEILRRLPATMRKRVILKGIDKALPHPLKFATNCKYCTSSIVDAQRQWNLTFDYSFIESVLDSCECKEEWENTLHDGIEMEERVEKYYRIMSKLLGIHFT